MEPITVTLIYDGIECTVNVREADPVAVSMDLGVNLYDVDAADYPECFVELDEHIIFGGKSRRKLEIKLDDDEMVSACIKYSYRYYPHDGAHILSVAGLLQCLRNIRKDCLYVETHFDGLILGEYEASLRNHRFLDMDDAQRPVLKVKLEFFRGMFIINPSDPLYLRCTLPEFLSLELIAELISSQNILEIKNINRRGYLFIEFEKPYTLGMFVRVLVTSFNRHVQNIKARRKKSARK